MADNKVERIIVGWSDEFQSECLVKLLGSWRSLEECEQVLNQMLTNPTPADKKSIGNLKNLRIKEVNSNKCWWNDPVLVN